MSINKPWHNETASCIDSILATRVHSDRGNETVLDQKITTQKPPIRQKQMPAPNHRCRHAPKERSTGDINNDLLRAKESK